MNKLIPIIVLGLAVAPFSANAADMASKKPPVRQAAPYFYHWTGFYAGAHFGYGWNKADRDVYILTTGEYNASSIQNSAGTFGGLQLGYNYQIGRTVLGVEGDFSLASIKGSITTLNSADNQIAAVGDTHVKTLASIRGRLGYAFNEILVFGTGGIAFKTQDGSRTQYATASTSGAAADFSTIPVFVEKHSSSNVGWTVGGGAEYAFDKNWSVTSSYRYTKWRNSSNDNPLALSTVFNYVAPGNSNGRVSYSTSSDQTVRMGVNYKF